MKAMQIQEFGPPEVMRYEEVFLPEPADDQILIDVKAVGVNPVDTYIRSGIYGPRQFPLTLGFDAAGVVRRVGAAVKRVAVGQRVFTAGSVSGTYAQQCLCLESQVSRLPEKTTFAQGAALGIPYGTAYRALFQRAHAAAGQSVLIHGGSGGVGLAAIQFAKAAGLTVIATAGTEEGRQLLREQGADCVTDHHAADHFDQVLHFTNEQGVDILLEMLANVNLAKDLKIMAKKGQLVIIGSRGPVEVDPRDIMARELNMYGTLVLLATETERAQAFTAIETGLTEGKLNPVIAMELPLGEAPRTHYEIMESAHHGKIVLIPE
jgi:NADPH2:quinone reductase